MAKANSKEIAARMAQAKVMALAIVQAFSGAAAAEDDMHAKGNGAFGLCVKVQTAKLSWEDIEAQQPSLVADKVTRTVFMASLPASQRDSYAAEHAGEMSEKVKTRLRSNWDSAKSVITRAAKAGFDLVDADGVPFTKNELSKLLAADKAKPGAQTGKVATDADADSPESGPNGSGPELTLAELCAKVFDALELAGGKGTLGYDLRTANAERILGLADTVQAEATQRMADIAAAVVANKAKGEKRAADKAAELAADQQAAAVELAGAGLTKKAA